MKHFRFTIGCGLCLAIFALAGCKPKPQYQMVGEPNADQAQSTPASTAPEQTPMPEPTPEDALKKLAETVRPAVILVTVFDPSGKLLRTGTGFFVSDSGRIITTWHTVEGSVNAVAKLANGEICNITGVLASSTKSDLAILNAEVKKVPFLVLSKTTKPDADTRVVMIGSALAGAEGAAIEGKFSVKESDEDEGEIELAASVPGISLGAPVVDQSGEVVGVVTAQGEKDEASNVVRTISAVKLVVTEISSNATARWPGEVRPSPTPRPHLVHMPRPIYPSEARFHDGVARSGRYRVNFDVNGTVKNIQVLQTTGSDVLDHAAIAGLQQWKCEPGREGFVIVPLTFQSR